jgi:hypothetical protein
MAELGARLSRAIENGLKDIPGTIGRLLSPLTDAVKKQFARLGRLTRIALKVTGLTIVINALVDLGKTVGRIFGGIGSAIEDRFNAAMTAVHRVALETALKILHALDFTILGRHIIPGVHGLVTSLQSQLDKLSEHTAGTTKKMQRSLDSVKGKTLTVDIKTSGDEHVHRLQAVLASTKDKTVTIKIDGAKSGEADVQKLRAALTKTDGKTVKVLAQVLGRADLEKLQQTLARAKGKEVAITVAGVPLGVAEVKRMLAAISGLSDRKITLSVVASMRGVREVQRALALVHGKTVAVTVAGTQIGRTNLKKLEAAVKNMKGKTIDVAALVKGGVDLKSLQALIAKTKGKAVDVSVAGIDLGKVKISELQRAIDGLRGKQVDIVTNFITVSHGERGSGTLAQPKLTPTQTKTEQRQEQAAGAKTASDQRQATAKAAAKAAAAAKKAQEKIQAAFAAIIDSFSLKLDKAAATKSFADDLAVLADEEAAVRKEIKIEGKTTDLERQLFQIEQQRADIRKQIREARASRLQASQFKGLGLTATGEKPIASVGALKKRLGTLTEQIKGTVLDTPKTRSELERIAKVLSGKFGKVGRDVRAAILQMFADIAGGLKQGAGPLTKTTSLNTKKLVEGLGLSPEQIRELRSRASHFNSAGLALAGTGGGGGIATVRDRGVPFVIENNVTVEIDGQKVSAVVTRQQQKTKRRNPQQKRGPHRR